LFVLQHINTKNKCGYEKNYFHTAVRYIYEGRNKARFPLAFKVPRGKRKAAIGGDIH